jgi:hypothetical protein
MINDDKGGNHSVPISNYYPGVCLEEQKKSTINLSEDIWSPAGIQTRHFPV